ncbi:MAG: protein kinase [Acidobacteriota bacterium]|nr:protein kinase [Acidobacteriota bacterium]
MIGQIIGNYKIEEKLGEGGMGAVYRGVDMMLEREVAVKVLRPELGSQPQVVERFRSEAVTLAKLNHPNIATLYSFFRQGDELFMVLEFVRGVTLDHVIGQRGALACEQAIPTFCQMLDGINHAHDFGIIHRDIKPANMMITHKGALKVLDFGIARILGTARMTRAGNVIGTIEYMAPEQVRGLETDARSDIYSLGMLLYEMLTGRAAFDIPNEFELMRAQIEQMPPLPSQLNPAIPYVVEGAIMRAIAKNPDERFQIADDFRAELMNAGYPATGRIELLAPGAASPYPTRPSQPPYSNPPIYSTPPSQLSVSAPPSQPGITSPPSAGDTAPPATRYSTGDGEATPPTASVFKETRIGMPGAFADAPATSGQMKETRIGVAPTTGAPAAPSQPFAPLPQAAPQQSSFFSKLTPLHYIGAGVAALVLLGVFVAVPLIFLLSGSTTPEAEPAKTQAEEKSSAPSQTVTQEQPAAPPVMQSEQPTLNETTTLPAEQQPAPLEIIRPAPAASTTQTRQSRPAPKAPAKPKTDDAAARRKRKAALDALDQ